MLVGGLQSINHPQDLSGVTARGGGVGHDQPDLLARVDDEDGTDGEGHSLGVDVGGVLEVDHVVQVGDLALGVRDNRELQLGAGDLVDVFNPCVVRLDAICALHYSSSVSFFLPVVL